MSEITITSQNYDKEILSSDKFILLDCWAPWCSPCRMLSPVITQIADEHPEIKVGKINIDEQPELAAKLEIMSIPTLLFIKNGEIFQKRVGFMPKDIIEELLDSYCKI